MQLVLILSALAPLLVFSTIMSYFVMIPITYYDNKNNRDKYPSLYSKHRGKTDYDLFMMSVIETTNNYKDAAKSFGSGLYKFFVYVIPFIALGVGAAAGAAWLVFHVSKLVFATVFGQLPF